MIAARTSAQQFDVPLAFDSVEELCRSSEVDAVLVATPNACHLRDVLIALKCGKPVLCEKPMAMHAGQCEQMVEAAQKAGLLLGVAQVFRFEESTAWLQRQISSGKIGRPVFARSDFCFSVGAQHQRSWIQNADVAGGGPIADVGVHCIDSLRFVLQDEVLRVSAFSTSDDRSGTVESSATLSLEFKQGTTASVFVSFRADYRTPIEIIGNSGVLRADDALSVDKPVTIELRCSGKLVQTEEVSNQLAYARQVEAFASAIEGKGAFPVPGQDGWQNQEVLDAAYRSAKSGRAEVVRQVVPA